MIPSDDAGVTPEGKGRAGLASSPSVTMSDVLPNKPTPPARETPTWKVVLGTVIAGTVLGLMGYASTVSSKAAEQECWDAYQREGASSIGVTYSEFDDTCYRD